MLDGALAGRRARRSPSGPRTAPSSPAPSGSTNQRGRPQRQADDRLRHPVVRTERPGQAGDRGGRGDGNGHRPRTGRPARSAPPPATRRSTPTTCQLPPRRPCATTPSSDAFEPGSTGKLMTMAAALEHGVVTPDTGVIIPNRLPRAGMKFKDHENHETEHLTATGVIAEVVEPRHNPRRRASAAGRDGADVPEVRRRPDNRGRLRRRVERPARQGERLECPAAVHRALRPGTTPSRRSRRPACSRRWPTAGSGCRCPLSRARTTTAAPTSQPPGAGHPGRLRDGPQPS